MLHSKSDDDIPADDATVVAVAVAVAADRPPLANTIEYEMIPKLLFVDIQQEDEEKVAAAVMMLVDLLNTSNANWKVNADQALSLGAIAIILLLMRKWHYSGSIQFHGCYVLGLLLAKCNGAEQRTNDEGRRAEIYCGTVYCSHIHRTQCPSCLRLQSRLNAAAAAAVSVIKSGGIETIMAAMKSFPDAEGIQGNGGYAIGNAFFYTDPTIDEAMARFAHKLNGIELVVRIMKKFQNNASVQKTCCHVLAQLSKKQVLHDALKKGGALSAVSESTEKHDDKSLQSMATAFFKNMFENIQ